MELKDILTLVGAAISIIISIIAMFRAHKANQKHNQLLKKLNSKEYQLNENLKETAVQIIAAVRAIDAKAAMAFEN